MIRGLVLLMLLFGGSARAQDAVGAEDWPSYPGRTVITLTPEQPLQVSLYEFGAAEPTIPLMELSDPLTFYVPNGSYRLHLDSGDGLTDNFDLRAVGPRHKLLLQKGHPGWRPLGVLLMVAGAACVYMGYGLSALEKEAREKDQEEPLGGAAPLVFFAGLGSIVGGIAMIINGDGDMEYQD
jgi:hypothetical protein